MPVNYVGERSRSGSITVNPESPAPSGYRPAGPQAADGESFSNFLQAKSGIDASGNSGFYTGSYSDYTAGHGVVTGSGITRLSDPSPSASSAPTRLTGVGMNAGGGLNGHGTSYVNALARKVMEDSGGRISAEEASTTAIRMADNIVFVNGDPKPYVPGQFLDKVGGVTTNKVKLARKLESDAKEYLQGEDVFKRPVSALAPRRQRVIHALSAFVADAWAKKNPADKRPLLLTPDGKESMFLLSPDEIHFYRGSGGDRLMFATEVGRYSDTTYSLNFNAKADTNNGGWVKTRNTKKEWLALYQDDTAAPKQGGTWLLPDLQAIQVAVTDRAGKALGELEQLVTRATGKVVRSAVTKRNLARVAKLMAAAKSGTIEVGRAPEVPNRAYAQLVSPTDVHVEGTKIFFAHISGSSYGLDLTDASDDPQLWLKDDSNIKPNDNTFSDLHAGERDGE